MIPAEEYFPFTLLWDWRFLESPLACCTVKTNDNLNQVSTSRASFFLKHLRKCPVLCNQSPAHSAFKQDKIPPSNSAHKVMKTFVHLLWTSPHLDFSILSIKCLNTYSHCLAKFWKCIKPLMSFLRYFLDCSLRSHMKSPFYIWGLLASFFIRWHLKHKIPPKSWIKNKCVFTFLLLNPNHAIRSSWPQEWRTMTIYILIIWDPLTEPGCLYNM